MKFYQDSSLRRKIRDYFMFLSILAAIFSLVELRGDYILAPPYAVSAYIIVFQRNTKYSSRKSLAITYILVIISSDVLHVIFSDSLPGMILDVLVVSGFITFTNYSHPPAIALTIFSYLVASPLDFTFSSVLSLLSLLISSILMENGFFKTHDKIDAN